MIASRPTTVTMSELRDNLSSYLDDAARGVVITVTRRGKPSAILSAAKGMPDPIDVIELEHFRLELGVQSERSAVTLLRDEERY